MTPIKFIGCNVIFAKDQPEYLPLIAHRDKEGCVTTCWELTFYERILVLFKGVLYLQTLTFNNNLQPQKPSVWNPIKETKNV